MNINRIIEIAKQQMANHRRPCREVGYLFNHGLRTGKLAVRLAGEIDQAPSVDPERKSAAVRGGDYNFPGIGKPSDLI